MARKRITRLMGAANIDSVDVWFLSVALARYAAFVAWADVIVRAIRGEEAKENWKTLTSSAALIGFSALTSAAEVREFASLRGAAVEMRALVGDAAAEAELRDERAAERDRRVAEQQEGMLRLNKRAIILAALTLGAAVVTLAVTIAR
jgi:hypothetical protein